MALADYLDLIFEAFGRNVKVGARPPAFLENELPHFVEACIDLGEAHTNLSRSARIDAVESHIDCGEPRIDLGEASIDLVESRIDVVESRIDLVEIDGFDLVEAPIDMSNRPFRSLSSISGQKAALMPVEAPRNPRNLR